MIRFFARFFRFQLLLLLALAPSLAFAQSTAEPSTAAVPLDEIKKENPAPHPPPAPNTNRPVTATVKKAHPKPVTPANEGDAPAQAGDGNDSFLKGQQSPADQESIDAMMESTVSRTPGETPATQKLPMPRAIEDTAEGWNRSSGVLNDQILMWIVRPLEKGYTAIAPAPARKHIQKMGKNLEFPNNFINCLLQAKFLGATVETGRFLVNTTVGILGLYDPASKMGMRPYPEDFGLTFAAWGWRPSSYFVFPFVGPGSSRDFIGGIFDMIPLWFSGSTFFKFNDYSFLMPSYQNLRATERDPYVMLRDLWAINRERGLDDFQMNPTKGDAAPTLDAVFLDVKDPEFPAKSREYSVRIPEVGKKLPYSVWLQDHRAPLVFFLPGVGSHRLAGGSLAMAEMIYNHGCSVVTISNAMNWEFMESASRAAVPGYTPVDARDVYAALDAIYGDLKDRYPYQFTTTALMGLSLGALHTLFISGMEVDNQQKNLKFDRYVAINPPVDLLHALSQLDVYFNAPMQWGADVRDKKIKDTMMKAIEVSQSDLTPSVGLPFDYIESQFLIGLNFRFILRDIIYSSQKRTPLGVLQTDASWFFRQPLYDEIYQYSYIDYLNKFVLPYYMKQSEKGLTREQLMRQANLWSIERELKKNDKIKVFTNTNDFLLRERDIDWLHNVLGDQRLSVFTEGGHLGNLHLPRVQDRIMESLTDLKGQ